MEAKECHIKCDTIDCPGPEKCLTIPKLTSIMEKVKCRCPVCKVGIIGNVQEHIERVHEKE